MTSRPGPPGSLRDDRVLVAVGAVAVAALAARLVGLGGRPFHWDEARVGYWTLRFLDTGAYEYRPVAGGPLLYVVGRPVFALLGASDATARLPVALVGGLFPLAALLFRERLGDGETALLAALLAFDPLALYYSRFLRGDLPAAAFGLVAVGAAVRLYDGDRRFAPVAAAAAALALGASGMAVAYPLAWAAAGLLVLDHARLLGRPDRARARLAAVRDRLRAGWPTALRSTAVGAAVFLFLYAPRSGGSGPGLWRPTTLPAVLEAAFVGTARKFVGVRVLGRRSDGTHQLLPYVGDAVETLVAASPLLVALALVALLRDRYGPGEPRPLVAFAGYWGLVGVVLFPAVTEVAGPWVALHAAVPLAVPAAVGGAAAVRVGVRAVDERRTRDAAAAGLVVVAAVAGTGAVAAGAYGPSAPGDGLASYGQPADDLAPFHANVSAVADGEDPDVLYYGPEFDLPPERGPTAPPVGDAWGHRLPLPWYTERAGASVTSSTRPSALSDPPPVVVANASRRGGLAPRLEGYEASEYRLALWTRRVVVFVRR